MRKEEGDFNGYDIGAENIYIIMSYEFQIKTRQV